MSVCVSSVVDGVCVSVCVSSVVDRKGVCAHVTRLHALCGNKLPPFYVPPGCSHWVRARGGGPGAQGRRVEAGASACVRCGDGTLLSSQDVWQPHHALTFLWGQGCLVWSSPSQLVEGLTGSPRRGPVSLLLPSGGCLRFRFSLSLRLAGPLWVLGPDDTTSPGVPPSVNPAVPHPQWARSSCVFSLLSPLLYFHQVLFGPATSCLVT